MRARSFPVFFASALVLLAVQAQAQTKGTERGLALAREWCSRCHAVTPTQEPRGETDVPPFRRIAADRRWTRERLIHMITVPHINMPPPVLTLEEAAEVATYILSLRD